MNGFWAAVCLSILVCPVDFVQAQIFTGKITKRSADSQSITVYSASQMREQSFLLNKRGVKILLNGKQVRADQLRAGDRVTLFSTPGGQLQRVVANREEEPAPAEPPQQVGRESQ